MQDDLLEKLLRFYFYSTYVYIRKSYRNIKHEDAQDIVQKTIMKVWCDLKKFDPKRSNIKTWLFFIAKNKAKDFLRKQQRIKSVFTRDVPEAVFIGPIDLPLELVIHQETLQRLKIATTKLSAIRREIIILRYENGLKFRQIADLLNKPSATVRANHRLALIDLREKLKRGDK